ncbi:MAG: hypothetical protein AAGL23_11705 [Pseudomonadota bacterium]
MPEEVTVSAPGSTLITGEHAVIYGAPCVAAAIEQRAHVRLRFTTAKTLAITSEIAPPATLPTEGLVAQGPYRFVIAAVLAYADQLEGGVDIVIQSEINHTLGLGSSAAVTVATLAALAGGVTDDLHTQALRIIRDIQGRGSGADLAASLFGGALSYRVEGGGPADIRTLPAPPAMSLFNVGYKTPTSEVLALVAKARDADPNRIDGIFDDMARVSADTIALINDGKWDAIGPHMSSYQQLMVQLGVSDTALDAAVARALGHDGVIGAKISGSGLGDCVLALGDVPEGFTPVQLARQGVVFHDNA